MRWEVISWDRQSNFEIKCERKLNKKSESRIKVRNFKTRSQNYDVIGQTLTQKVKFLNKRLNSEIKSYNL